MNVLFKDCRKFSEGRYFGKELLEKLEEGNVPL